MPHDYVRDIIPPHDREDEGKEEHVGETPDKSIRNITLPGKNRTMPPPQPPRTRTPSRTSKPLTYGLLGLLAVIVIGGVVGITAFQSTSVTVTPKTESVTFTDKATITAYPNDPENAGPGKLTYTVLSQSVEASSTVPASGTKQVDEFSSGTITVYNEYSDQPVKLIKNTRFATPEGLVFRAKDAITIPGFKKSGSSKIPGAVTAVVVADKAGEAYNVGPVSKFTLPALQETKSPMYTSVYASSKAAMTGGFSGVRPGVDEATLTAARDSLHKELETRVREALIKASPQGTYIAPALVSITYESGPITPGDAGTARIQERAIATAPVFDAALLADALAASGGASLSGSSIKLVNPDSFTLSTADVGQVPNYGTTPLILYVAGSATFVSTIDAQGLSQTLAGKDKAQFQDIVKVYPGIVAGDASVFPFWNSHFPTDPAKIQVTVQEPK